MQVYDKVEDKTLEVKDADELMNIMINGRQVDIIWNEKKIDADGYLTWDVEHWSAIDSRRFIRTYSLEGKQLGESTGHNIYDLKNECKPELAAKVELS